MIVMNQFLKCKVGKRYTLGKTRANGIYKLLGDAVGIFLQIPSGRRADGDGAGIPLGRHHIRPKSHWDVGRQA